MADDYVNQVTEFQPVSSPSIPLHLSGFLAGDTVRVQGDTGELEFSLQFSIQRREQNSGGPGPGPGKFSDANIEEIDTFVDSVDSLSSASYSTPTSGHEIQDRDAGANELSEESWMRRDDIVTRLRSGVLSPVKYNASGGYGFLQGRLSSGKKMKIQRGKGYNALERMLKRRSFPLRPCNSYAFFVMANWGVIKCSSFEETSKRLSKKWCELPNDMKKEYENMASKDTARYMRQCLLLKNDVQEETGSGLLEDMK